MYNSNNSYYCNKSNSNNNSKNFQVTALGIHSLAWCNNNSNKNKCQWFKLIFSLFILICNSNNNQLNNKYNNKRSL